MARVLVSMKDDFLKRVDEVADNEQRSRSELIREALRDYIRRNGTRGLEMLRAADIEIVE